MQGKDLAKALGISGAMVSRLKKRGMPTDSIERAERWRRRHLETARLKGNRLDSRAEVQPPAQQSPRSARALSVEAQLAQRLGDAAHELAGGPDFGSIAKPLRQALRTIPVASWPALSLAVWRDLVLAYLHREADVRTARCDGTRLTIEQFADRVTPGNALPCMWIEAVEDLDDIAIDGWPAELCGPDLEPPRE